MSATLFEAAAEKTAKTWNRYIVALCILQLTLMIDQMSGAEFLCQGKPIDLAGFKVVREALSATYGILFAVFIGAAYLESRLLRESAPGSSAMERPAVIDLWFVSPFSKSLFFRFLFWGALVYGFVLLAIFSVIHLAAIGPPRSNTVSSLTYRAIGAGDLLVLIFSTSYAFKIYRNLEEVRSKLMPRSGERPKEGRKRE
jgi:hypothetical protein